MIKIFFTDNADMRNITIFALKKKIRNGKPNSGKNCTDYRTGNRRGISGSRGTTKHL
jgi:hypothetical protein